MNLQDFPRAARSFSQKNPERISRFLTTCRTFGFPWALVGILFLSVALRLWGINAGLPFPYHPDEPFLVEMARNMIRTGNLDPPAWDYPSVQVYSLVALIAYRQMLSSIFPVLAPEWIDYLFGRLLNVAYAVATVYLTYRIGRRCFGRGVGLLAAAFIGFSDLHNYNSHFLMTDVPATFFVTATVAAALSCLQRPSPIGYALVGGLAGLAASTKYPVATVLVVVPIVHLLEHGRQAIRRGVLLVVAAVSAVLVFVITSPYVVLDASHFWQSFVANDVDWAATGHEGAEGNVLRTYLEWLFLHHEAPVAWLALVGVFLGIARRHRVVLVASIFVLCYFVTLLPWQVRFPRYLLPILPFLSLLAAFAFVEGERLAARRFDSSRFVVPLAMLVILISQFQVAADRSATFAAEDVRTTALHWIQTTLPEGSRIVREDYTPIVPSDRYRVTLLARAIDRDLAWYRREGVEYLILSRTRSGRYFQDPERYSQQVAKYRQLLAVSQLVREFRGPELGARGGVVSIYRYAP